ncbi:MAG: hypothetical protein M0D57_05255 [Sphingobacteriales bacterium JAD_PAG50586_3]|nr:MAG: hypothetical protein M0D57_05255 [Sphingobacteriales bacterium JAD_PAG50586_3]
MEVISTHNQLLKNIETFEKYLKDKQYDREKTLKLIKRGACFVVYKANGEIKFAPSRFLGYKNNSLKLHTNSVVKDGRITNPAISKILNETLFFYEELEQKFLKYCKTLGIEPDNKKRKYWNSIAKLRLEIPDYSVSEGSLYLKTHLAKERNRFVVALAKANFKNEHGKLFCEACKENHLEKYGKDYEGCIEAHHMLPVSKMKEGHKTKAKDFVMLCANCHRIVHRKNPWLTTIEEIRKIVQKTKRG